MCIHIHAPMSNIIVDFFASLLQLSRVLSKEFNEFLGLQDLSIFGLSVQFLNRDIFVREIADKHGFLSSLFDSLRSSLLVMSHEDSDLLVNIVKNRRYSVIITDIKIVAVIDSISRRLAATQTGPLLQILAHFHVGSHPNPNLNASSCTRIA